MLVIGHRGASHDFPENTLVAFQGAADQGADGVELDVRRTPIKTSKPVTVVRSRCRHCRGGTQSRCCCLRLRFLHALYCA